MEEERIGKNEKKSSSSTLPSQHPARAHRSKYCKRKNCICCSVCGKAFFQESLFKNHMNIHAKNLPFKCSKCSVEFKLRISLFVHMRFHRDTEAYQDLNIGSCKLGTSPKDYDDGGDDDDDDNSSEGANSPQNPPDMSLVQRESYLCPTCKMGFNDEKLYNDHIAVHGSNLCKMCSVCAKEFESSNDLEVHMQSHEPSESSKTNKDENKKCLLSDSFMKRDQHNAQSEVRSRSKSDDEGSYTYRELQNKSLEECSNTSICVCKVCKKQFSSDYLLKNHVAVHSQDLPINCLECKRQFSFKYALQVHMRYHADGKSYKSGNCKTTTNNHHVDGVSSQKCKTVENLTGVRSSKFYDSKNSYRNHMTEHSKGTSIQCSLCEKKFKFSYALQAHMRSHASKKVSSRKQEDGSRGIVVRSSHNDIESSQGANYVKDGSGGFNSDEPNRQSEKCEKNLSQTNQNKHLHQCLACGKHFDGAKSFKNHVVARLGQSLFKCPICSKQFKFQCVLEVHIRKHREEKLSKISDNKSDHEYEDDSLGKYQEDKTRESSSYKIPSVCFTCGKVYLDDKLYNNHIIVHSKNTNIKCLICGQKFRFKYALQVHMRVHALKKSPCKLEEDDLESHIDTNESFVVCFVCGKPYSKRSLLQNHLKIHSTESPILCSVCGLECKFKYALHVHMRKHADLMLSSKPDLKANTEIDQSVNTGKCKRKISITNHLEEETGSEYAVKGTKSRKETEFASAREPKSKRSKLFKGGKPKIKVHTPVRDLSLGHNFDAGTRWHDSESSRQTVSIDKVEVMGHQSIEKQKKMIIIPINSSKPMKYENNWSWTTTYDDDIVKQEECIGDWN